jgi:hypothetical protein
MVAAFEALAGAGPAAGPAAAADAADAAAGGGGATAGSGSGGEEDFELPLWPDARDTLMSAMDAKLALLQEREAQLEAELSSLSAPPSHANSGGGAPLRPGATAAPPGAGTRRGARGSRAASLAGSLAGASALHDSPAMAALRQQLLSVVARSGAAAAAGLPAAASGHSRAGRPKPSAAGSEVASGTVFDRWAFRWREPLLARGFGGRGEEGLRETAVAPPRERWCASTSATGLRPIPQPDHSSV